MHGVLPRWDAVFWTWNNYVDSGSVLGIATFPSRFRDLNLFLTWPFAHISAPGGEAGLRPQVEVVIFFQVAPGSGHMVGRLLAPHPLAGPSFPRHILSPRRSALAACALVRFTPMGWTAEEHRWRVAVDPPQTGPPQARLRTAYGRPQTTYKGALRPRTHACHPPSHAPCARTHYRASASRSCADQRWRPPADASTSTTTAGASPRRSATRRLLLPMRRIGGSMRRMRMCRTHVHGCPR